MDQPGKKTSTLTIAVAWTLVTIPLGWGVFQSVIKSLPLFQVAASSLPPPTAPQGR